MRASGEWLARIGEIEARIEKLVAGGDGLARVEGVPVFVPRSAPGDLLRLRLVERRPSYGRAEIVEILEPGPGRRTPPCTHYERCGGCNLQHLDDSLQLRLKVEAVRENLLRLGRIEVPSDVKVVAGDPWGYRLRAQLHVGDGDGGREVGYFARGSHDLVAVESCPILVPDLERELPTLARRLGEATHRRLDLAAGDGGEWTCAPPLPDLPRGEVSTRVGDLTYRYDARSFFQIHRQLLPQLVEHALGTDSGDGGGTAYDLFAGVGLFSLPLARRYRRVVAVEGERGAARMARINARRNHIANLTVEPQAVESWIVELPAGAERVLVDPPRVGLTSTVRRALVERRPRHLTYVSCDSASLARDLKLMRTGFRVSRLALLDMFPQTGHMEVVVQLVDRDLVTDSDFAIRGKTQNREETETQK